MTRLALICSLFLLTSCTTMTELHQNGGGWVQMKQTNNLWEDNAVVVTTCDTLNNGFCPAGSPSYVVVMPGKLPALLGTGIQGAAFWGSSAIIADGLKGSKSKTTVTQRNKTDIRASTVNPK